MLTKSSLLIIMIHRALYFTIDPLNTVNNEDMINWFVFHSR